MSEQTLLFLVYYLMSLLFSMGAFIGIKDKQEKILETWVSNINDNSHTWSLEDWNKNGEIFNKKEKYWKKFLSIFILTYPISVLLCPPVMLVIWVILLIRFFIKLVKEQIQVLRS